MSMDTAAARSSRPAARCVRTEVRWRWARRGPRRAEDTSRCLGGAADRPHHAGLRGRGHLQPNRAAHQRTIAGWESVASHRPTRVAASGAVRTRRGDGRMVAAVANLGLGGGQKPVRGRHHNGSGPFPARSELWKTADEPSKMHAFYTSVTIGPIIFSGVEAKTTVSPARSICIKFHPIRLVQSRAIPESQSLCHPRSRKPCTRNPPNHRAGVCD